MEYIHTSTLVMTNILIAVIALLLSANFILDTDIPCPVEWTDNLRNHQERMSKCKLVSQNRYLEWVLKD